MVTTTEFLTQTALQTTANIVSNLAWFILLIWGFRTIGKGISSGVDRLGEKVPLWLEKYESIIMKKRAVDRALIK